MKITFEGENLTTVLSRISDFLIDLKNRKSPAEPAQETPGPTSSPDGDQTEKPAKSTRTTRKRSKRSSEAESDGENSSASMAGGRKRRQTSTASDEDSQDEKPEPTTRRRRARSTENNAQIPAAKGRTRKRASAASPSDDLKDTDLSKAASALADATNPQVVMDLLKKFNVTKVGELEGDARREFVTAAAEIAEDQS